MNSMQMNNNIGFSVDTSRYSEDVLVALGDADNALAFAPKLALDHPHTLDAVTPELLTKAIAAGVPGAAIQGLAVVDGHDGMTSRCRWKVEWNRAGQDAGLPAALFAKATPAIDYHRKSIAILHLHEGESNYYRYLHKENPNLAPDVYYNGCYAGGRFLLILEDLIESGCRPFWQADECTIEHARAVAVAQAGFHAKYWESERLLGDLSWARPRSRRFGWPWLRDEFHAIRDGFLREAKPEELPEGVRGLLKIWAANADAVFSYWETRPPTVIHGDSHLGNTFSRPDGTAGYYDWQVIFRGNGLRDLSYFLMSALTNDDRISYEREIVYLYVESLAANGVVLDRAAAWDEYCLYVFDRWDAVITEFMKGGYGHARSAMLRTVETIAGAIIDNDVTGRINHLIRTKLHQ